MKLIYGITVARKKGRAEKEGKVSEETTLMMFSFKRPFVL